MIRGVIATTPSSKVIDSLDCIFTYRKSTLSSQHTTNNRFSAMYTDDAVDADYYRILKDPTELKMHTTKIKHVFAIYLRFL